MNTNEKMYYVLGLIDAIVPSLSFETDGNLIECRKFLVNRVCLYLDGKDTSISLDDMIEFGLIK